MHGEHGHLILHQRPDAVGTLWDGTHDDTLSTRSVRASPPESHIAYYNDTLVSRLSQECKPLLVCLVHVVSSGGAGNLLVKRVPRIQPTAPRPRVKPNQTSRTVVYGTLNTDASMPARIIPMVRPVVTPIKHPGCARFFPRKRFIMRLLPIVFRNFLHTDDNAPMWERQVSNYLPIASTGQIG